MTPTTALTPQRARDLGRTLACRLHPLPDDPGRLHEAAVFALQSLLPTWLPPGEEASASALRQLVHQEAFSTFLLAPAAAGDDEAGLDELRIHLARTVPDPLQPLLLIVCQSCREALRGLPASPVPRQGIAAAGSPPGSDPPTEAATAASTSAAAQDPGPGGSDRGSLLVFALAALACFAAGWLGYRMMQSFRPAGDADPEAQRAVDGGGAAPASPMAGPLATADATATRQDPGRDGTSPLNEPDPSRTRVVLQRLSGTVPELQSAADPSNFGPRENRDAQGRPVPSTPALIVLHETVVDEQAALALFQRRHGSDNQQASYHVLIARDGRRLRVVPDEMRAYGAGDSRFRGLEVQLRPGVPPSVNNIALHVSLVSPPDGADGEARSHSGYTAAQYRSLARQVALWQSRYGIGSDRVVTHQGVDNSGTRRDPRSLDWSLLGREHRNHLQACSSGSPVAGGLRPGDSAP